MSVQVHTVPEPWGDDLVACEVVTVDATGKERCYEISLMGWELDDGHVLGGQRVDDDALDEPAGGGVSQLAYDVARRHFRDLGYEVHGA